MAQESKPALGWAARDASGLLSPYSFSRRAQKEDDVTIKVLFCGICHTDLHVAKNEWGNAMYPVVPGHEIVGVVTGVGRGVWSFKAGDTVGVGSFIGSCRACESCAKGYENNCPALLLTCNGVDYDGATTQGLRRRQPGLRPPRPGGPAAGRGGASPLRRRHGVQPHGAVRPERAGDAPGRRRPGRPRPHGRQVRQGVRDDGNRDQLVAEEARGGGRAPRRRRLPGQPRRRGDEGRGGHDGRHRRHGVGGAPAAAAAGAAEADGADGAGGRADRAHGAAGLGHRHGREAPGRERRGQRARLPGDAGLRGGARHRRGRRGRQDGVC
uniref:cinnamyl-alcohol dehydrogenase n=1 Tax=Triticum urartu TaxID=4572 RepID=A0A8R7R0I2_TRIUA